MLLQNAPTPFNGVVLAVIGRIVEQLNRFADVVTQGHQSIQELSAYPTILRTVINLDLYELYALLFGWCDCVPPLLQVIDDKIACFVGIAKGEVQLCGVLIENAAGDIFCSTAHIMVTGFRLGSSLSLTR